MIVQVAREQNKEIKEKFQLKTNQRFRSIPTQQQLVNDFMSYMDTQWLDSDYNVDDDGDDISSALID